MLSIQSDESSLFTTIIETESRNMKYLSAIFSSKCVYKSNETVEFF